MSSVINIEIGGIYLSIYSQDSITLQNTNPSLDSFFVTEKSITTTCIDIILEFGSMPDTTQMTKVFDSGHSWTMLRNGDSYVVVLNTPASDNKPFWVARFDRDVQHVKIHMGEMLFQESDNKLTIPNIVRYPLGQILLMYYLSQREGALIHAAGLCFHDRGYIFPGKSGAGKSTISRQLTGLDDYKFLSDDRIIVRKMDKTFKAFGTPWPGEAGIALNKSVDLSGIFFISQASFNRIEEINPQKSMERLLPVVSIPWYDKEVMIKILDFCEDLISNVPVYELHFKPGDEIINVFQNFISK